MRCEAQETQRARSDKEEVPANVAWWHVGVAEQKQHITTRLQRPWDTYRQLPAILPFTNYIRIYCFHAGNYTARKKKFKHRMATVIEQVPSTTLYTPCARSVYPVYCPILIRPVPALFVM